MTAASTPGRHSDPDRRGDPPSPVAQAVALSIRALLVVVAVLAVAWLASGTVAVQPGDRAVVLRLGAVDRDAGAGLVVALPRPLEDVVVVPGPERQLHLVVSDLDLAEPDRPRASDGIDLRKDGGYVLTADGGIVHLQIQVVYQVSDARAWVLAGGRASAPGPQVADSLRRATVAAAIAAGAMRTLDGVMVANGGPAGKAGSSDLAASRARDRLRAELVAGTNFRLAAISGSGANLGVQVTRIDLTTRLPAKAQRAYDAVLSESQAADRRVAEARAAAERTVQAARQAQAEIQTSAEAARRETVATARAAADRVTALAAERSPERRRLLLTNLWRERLDKILRRCASVTAVDGRTPVRVAVPGEQR